MLGTKGNQVQKPELQSCWVQRPPVTGAFGPQASPGSWGEVGWSLLSVPPFGPPPSVRAAGAATRARPNLERCRSPSVERPDHGSRSGRLHPAVVSKSPGGLGL